MSSQSKPFLGTGLGFPVQAVKAGAPDAGGVLATAAFEESVRQSIWIILGTSPGERVMRPDFGCGLQDLVFELNNAATAGHVTSAVQDALLRFEPRIDVRDVQVTSDNGGLRLPIDIEYEVRATNNVFNLVYPFYLEKGPDQ